MDILCVGEILVDFIGDQYGKSISKTKSFSRYLGGSTANLAVNAKRIGLDVNLVAAIGNDGLGKYLHNELVKFGLKTTHIAQLTSHPTSVIFVSRSNDTPDFLPVRGADTYISEKLIDDKLLSNTTVFHTSCFALSKEPARSVIMRKAKQAYMRGCKLSIDINYSQKIWNDKAEAIHFIKEYCALNPLVKISADDTKRLFGNTISYEDAFSLFHSYGADTVCLTLGSKGVILAEKEKKLITKPAISVSKVIDVTGAGDAFWSGFLFGYIKNYAPEQCVSFGLNLAHIKLQHVGHLPKNTNVTLPV